MENIRLIAVVFVLLSAGGVSSFVLSKFARKKLTWYMPTFAGLLGIGYLSYLIEYGDLEGFEGLGYVIFIMMLMMFVTGNILANLVIHWQSKVRESKEDVVEEKVVEDIPKETE